MPPPPRLPSIFLVLHGPREGDRGSLATALSIHDLLSDRYPTPHTMSKPSRARFEATVKYLTDEVKHGVVFLIRAGRVRSTLIISNTSFKTPWSWSAVTLPDGEAVTPSVFHQFVADNGLQPANVELEAMWASKNVLCSVEQPNGCNPQQALKYFDMLEECARTHVLPDVDLFVNRRDCPWYRRDGKHCYSFAGPCRPVSREPRCPVASVYQGDAWLDLPILEPDAPIQAVGTKWERKIEKAFFRGSATGQGACKESNTRMRVASISGDCVDCGITSWTKRLRIEKGCLRAPINQSVVAAIDSREWSKWKYLIYVDGHSAALRYGGMMSCESVILKVDSIAEIEDAANRLWFFESLKGVRFQAGLDEIAHTADHICLQADEIVDCVKYLREHDDLARVIARNARDFFIKEFNSTRRMCHLARQVETVALS